MKDTQEVVNFGERVLYTEEFLQAWRELSHQKQQIVRKKVDLLIANPDHCSLKMRHLQGNLYEYLMDTLPYRLWFGLQGNKIILVRIGSRLVANETSIATAIDDLRAARNTAVHRTEPVKVPDIAQPQKSYREDFIVASEEKVMTAFLESEPQFENLYRRLADI
jgi:mRNA-degrading endonuclease RelE of RelBE toxin-antitoxin system